MGGMTTSIIGRDGARSVEQKTKERAAMDFGFDTVQSPLSLVALAQNRRPEPRPKGAKALHVAFSLILHTLPLFILRREGTSPRPLL